jgi:hypothetical protein
MLKVLDFWLCLLMRFQLLTISLGYQCVCHARMEESANFSNLGEGLGRGRSC